MPSDSYSVHRDSLMWRAFHKLIEREVAMMNALAGESETANQHRAAEGIYE